MYSTNDSKNDRSLVAKQIAFLALRTVIVFPDFREHKS